MHIKRVRELYSQQRVAHADGGALHVRRAGGKHALYYNPTVPHSPLSKLILSDGVCSDGTTVSIHHFLYAHDDVMYTRFFLYSTILLLVKTDDM